MLTCKHRKQQRFEQATLGKFGIKAVLQNKETNLIRYQEPKVEVNFSEKFLSSAVCLYPRLSVRPSVCLLFRLRLSPEPLAFRVSLNKKIFEHGD